MVLKEIGWRVCDGGKWQTFVKTLNGHSVTNLSLTDKLLVSAEGLWYAELDG
jgi:hypothetical protein